MIIFIQEHNYNGSMFSKAAEISRSILVHSCISIGSMYQSNFDCHLWLGTTIRKTFKLRWCDCPYMK